MFLVFDKNMKLKEFPEGVRPLDIFISSISKNVTQEYIEGAHGFITQGFTFEQRNIELDLLLISNDTRDYRLLRDAVYNFFYEDEFMYVTEEFQKGKRYKVTTVDSFIPDRFTQTVSNARFNLSMVDLPFAESVGTTKIIDENGILSDDELWGFGLGLIDDPDSHKYTHTGTSFKIYNAGNESIHPFFQQHLKITINNVQGSTSYFQLENNTNGSLFRVNEGVNSSQEIVLDGPNVTSNGLAYLRKTNKGFIELSPGWNEFTVTGATSATVNFDFRFYYK